MGISGKKFPQKSESIVSAKLNEPYFHMIVPMHVSYFEQKIYINEFSHFDNFKKNFFLQKVLYVSEVEVPFRKDPFFRDPFFARH